MFSPGKKNYKKKTFSPRKHIFTKKHTFHQKTHFHQYIFFLHQKRVFIKKYVYNFFLNHQKTCFHQKHLFHQIICFHRKTVVTKICFLKKNSQSGPTGCKSKLTYIMARPNEHWPRRKEAVLAETGGAQDAAGAGGRLAGHHFRPGDSQKGKIVGQIE